MSDLACPITNVRTRTGQIGQFGPETVDKASIRAVNNQSCSSILLLTQLAKKSLAKQKVEMPC